MGLPLPAFSLENLHPILVNFTAALVPASVLSDLLGRMLGRDSLKHAAWWTLLYAAAATPFTALTGWFWKRSIEAALSPDLIAVHQWLGIWLACAFPALLVWRWRFHGRGESPGLAYFVTAALTLLALIYQGHVGGSMAFG
ncbi:MAG TPA: DUF2231 domain-containing protein [Pyrinomonadaceae bacterium]|jgi:uncharacterized membrane protein